METHAFPKWGSSSSEEIGVVSTRGQMSAGQPTGRWGAGNTHLQSLQGKTGETERGCFQEALGSQCCI